MKYQKLLKLEVKGLYGATLLFDTLDINDCGIHVKVGGLTVFNALVDGYKLECERKVYSPACEMVIVTFKLVKGEE